MMMRTMNAGHPLAVEVAGLESALFAGAQFRAAGLRQRRLARDVACGGDQRGDLLLVQHVGQLAASPARPTPRSTGFTQIVVAIKFED